MSERKTIRMTLMLPTNVEMEISLKDEAMYSDDIVIHSIRREMIQDGLDESRLSEYMNEYDFEEFERVAFEVFGKEPG